MSVRPFPGRDIAFIVVVAVAILVAAHGKTGVPAKEAPACHALQRLEIAIEHLRLPDVRQSDVSDSSVNGVAQPGDNSPMLLIVDIRTVLLILVTVQLLMK